MRKEQRIKRNIYEWYEGDKFESAIQYAVTYKNIVGVDEYLSELQSKYKNYSSDIDLLINEERQVLEDRFEAWDISAKIESICKVVCIISVIIYFMSLFVHLPDILEILIVLIFVISCIFTVILKIASDVFRYRYNKYFEIVITKEKSINAKYINDVSAIRKKVDDLYLESLEPAHREVVLMRRDQERQHQERMRIEQERLNSQKLMEDEQRKTRQTQEELLRIEREREERYWKNRK